MSSAPKERHYWDACLFIDLVNATKGRAEVIGSLWDQLVSSEPDVVASTSVLSIAEVAFVVHEKKLHTLDQEALRKIDGFWSPGSPIELVEVYPLLVFEARRMIRLAVEDGHSLKAHDAVHFAAAKRKQCSRFWTYDERLYKFSGKFGFVVAEPQSNLLAFPA